MRSHNLGLIPTIIFDDYLIIGFDKRWISLNENNPIEFSAKVEEGRLVLSGKLASLDRTKEVDTYDM